jgi:ketosteroid isomerase-like protein
MSTVAPKSARAVAAIVLLCVAPVPSSADDVTSDREVARALSTFLTAFENLVWPAFRESFADDATAFFPTPEPPEIVVGRAAVEAQFEKVFASIRRSAAGGPPYHRLQPVGQRITMLGPTLALATFELRNTERIARRTLVFKQVDGRWLIVHLHASNVTLAG